MVQYPIPDDWDGVSYCCSIIEWPSSQQWRAFFVGLLTTPSRGRTWDGATGNIKATQLIGEEIIKRNLVECQDMKCLDDIIEAINGISVALRATAGNCCTGGTKPSFPPTINPTEGDPPPPGYDPPSDPPGTPAYLTRKCKVANAMVEDIKGFVDAMANAGLDAYINGGFLSTAIFIAVSTLVSALLGELATPVPIIDALAGALVGFVASIITAIATNDMSFEEVSTEIDENYNGLVCALISSANAQEAQDAFLLVLENSGLGLGGRLLVKAIMIVDMLAALYFTPEDVPDFEMDIELYEPPFDCASCCQFCFSNIGPRSIEDGTLLNRLCIPGMHVLVEVQAELQFIACSEGIYRIALKVDDPCTFVVSDFLATSGAWSKWCCNPGCLPADANDGYGFMTRVGMPVELISNPVDILGIELEELVIWSATDVAMQFTVIEP